MIRFIFWAIFLYLFVRFIVNFVLPVLKAARQMKQQVNEFNDRTSNPGRHTQRAQPAEQSSPKATTGDYIDFEEIRN